MNNQEIVTLSLSCIMSLFFFLLAFFSHKISNDITPIKNIKFDETRDVVIGANIYIDNMPIGGMFRRLARAISGLAWGSAIGFILSMLLLFWQIYLLVKG
jgi:thiosulfate reductase cytochrome b subunit